LVDSLSKERRSWNMSRVHSKDTKPELTVRSILHRIGYRFRLHNKALPGKPDIVLAKYHTVIFVHGCFWHQHKNCPDASIPKTNTSFWEHKLVQNVERDKRTQATLRQLGWKILVVWECETTKPNELINKLHAFLKNQPHQI